MNIPKALATAAVAVLTPAVAAQAATITVDFDNLIPSGNTFVNFAGSQTDIDTGVTVSYDGPLYTAAGDNTSFLGSGNGGLTELFPEGLDFNGPGIFDKVLSVTFTKETSDFAAIAFTPKGGPTQLIHLTGAGKTPETVNFVGGIPADGFTVDFVGENLTVLNEFQAAKNPQPIPVPAGGLLLGTALAGLAAARRQPKPGGMG